MSLLSMAQKVEEPVFIWPEEKLTEDTKLVRTGDTYEVVTDGDRPMISFAPLEADLPEDCSQLSFDYFSPMFLDEFEVVFESNGKQVASAFSELGIMEGWSLFTIHLSQERKVWGKRGDVLRLRLGRTTGYRMQFRNIRFRKMNAFEKEQLANRTSKIAYDKKELHSLQQYLNNDFHDSVSYISVADTQIIISGYTQKCGDFYLAWLPLHVRTHIAIDESRLLKIPGKGPFTLHTSRQKNVDSGQRDALFSKWVIVEKNSGKMILRSHARYPDSITPKYHQPEELPFNKKGLGDFNAANPGMVKDIDSLGVSSVTVNIWLRGMLSSSAEDTSIAFSYNGKTYYANRHWIEQLDRTMIEACTHKLIVSAIILVDQAFQFSDTSIGKQMSHPDCDPAGVYCMPNIFSPPGMEYYGAALDFLAARYSRPDRRFGRIHHWIAQNEVDAGWTWTNMGEKDPLLYMDAYHSSLRMLYLTARKYNAHAKVLISLTHNWNWTPYKRFYRPKELLEILLRFSSCEGDFDWGIGYHPFPQSLFEPKSWLDDRTEFSLTTPMITFKNVEVIDAWVNQPHTFFRGRYRRLLYLSEQGPNSRDYSEQALLDQAASLAYVWKKIKRLDAVEVFHYQSWRDHRFDGGLRLGLRRYPDDETDPLGKKPVWQVFRCMGTLKEDKCFEFAKPIIGISSWSEVEYHKPIL